MFSHDEKDQRSFRYIMANLQESGLCRQVDLAERFGQNPKRLKRAVRQLRERGVESFFSRHGGTRRGTVLTAEKLRDAQRLLGQGKSRAEISGKLAVRYDTLSKAVGDGRLTQPEAAVPPGSTQSERNRGDSLASEGMGTACLRTGERVLAAMGAISGAPPAFDESLDMPFGGVLCALPALIENSLLHKSETLGDVKGYYTKVQILLVLAVMFLCRFRTVEQLRGAPPGELGGLLGLDRIPEARCLRRKTSALARGGSAARWSAEVSAEWMRRYPDTTGFLYVDGHIKTYSGKADLPRRYVSRQRLCLSGISYYWVNDALGQPFFAVERQIDRGMLDALRTEIVPRLLKDVPRQPGEDRLAEDLTLHRFIIVFDREGCSPAFFKEMWDEHRIACLTYRKNVTDRWDETDFVEVGAETPRGEPFRVKLARKDTVIGKGNDRVEVREVRKLTESGKQTAIITTARSLDMNTTAAHMFARWGQENFFAYAMHHYGIDGLTSYGEENFGDPGTVVNPKYRRLDATRRNLTERLKKWLLKQDRMDTLASADPNHKGHARWMENRSDAIETISDLKRRMADAREAIAKVDRHIRWDDLPEKERFRKLPSDRRTLLNTVGMICYRAETAMATVLAEQGVSLSEARAILQDLFTAGIDLKPDIGNKLLNVHVHSAPTRKLNQRLSALFAHLSQTETCFPGTDMKLVYHLNGQGEKLETGDT